MAFTICWHSGYVFHVALRIGEVNLFWDSLYFLIQKCPSFVFFLKSASNLNGNLNCSKELEHYAS